MQRSIHRFSRPLLSILVAVGAQIPILGAHATTILPALHNGSTVWTGNNPLPLDAAQIGAIVGAPGLGLFYGAEFGNAQLATANGNLSFTAKQSGLAGNGISVKIMNGVGANQALTVAVIGQEIVVFLATDASGAVTSTAAQVAAAVNANPAASALVGASAVGNSLVQSLSSTPLAPAIVETGPFAGSYQTAFANSTSSPQDASVTYGAGPAISASALFLYVRGTGQTPASYIYDLLAPAFSWNALDNLALTGFWPGDGAIAQLAIVGGARTSTPVPEGSSLALLMLGLGALAWSRRPMRSR